MLDARIRVPTSVRQPEDQYHLIMEYRDGDKWGSDVSKCSNRFILTRDSSNSRMTSMEPFFGKCFPSLFISLKLWRSFCSTTRNCIKAASTSL